ncbi:MAG TPA: cyclopropane-fatty-acyl-phospholipid synthase family protein [Steroidobacteraceae bacterium]
MNAVEKSLPPTSGPSEELAPVPPGAPAEGRPLDAWLLSKLSASLGDPSLEFAIRDGARVSSGTPVARVIFANRATLLAVLADPAMRFGDAYSDGSVTIEGDLVRMLEVVYRAGISDGKPGSLLRRALRRTRTNTLTGSRDNIHRHYDIGNQFYSLWLGSTMAYTCAYYPTPAATLDEAQVAKMDHVCRKLRLKSGETVVEAGCGWGSFALHMARRYGVRVRAFNISREQIMYAREHAQRAGLGGQVEYVEDDYRNIAGHYDAFVSVGMLEHVGVENYPELGNVARRALGGRGRGLIHTIGRNYPALLQPWIEKRIFPGACPPALSEMMNIFEPWDFSVLDVENLRMHYALTLRQWTQLYEAASDKVREMFDARFVRMWRLYLAGSIAAFSTGKLQLFQVLFAPGDSNEIPWNRADIYAG